VEDEVLVARNEVDRDDGVYGMANEEGDGDGDGDGGDGDISYKCCCCRDEEDEDGDGDGDGDGTREKKSELIWLGRFSLLLRLDAVRPLSDRAFFRRWCPRWLAVSTLFFFFLVLRAAAADWDDAEGDDEIARPSDRVRGKHDERLAAKGSDDAGESCTGERAPGVCGESLTSCDSGK
jgi:hypothetical protein